jgi:DNA-binding XRE family transcriptional regulator
LCRGLGISVVDLLGAADQKPPVGPEPAPRRAPQASLADGGRPGPRQPKSPRGTRPPSSDQACSANVRRLRIARDWSQVELARRAGLSQGAIQSIEAGTKSPSLRTVEQVAGALGVAPWELVVSEGALAPKSRARVGRRS